MKNISPTAVEFVLTKIEDGFLFERLAKGIVAALKGVDFIPVGGIHDKGIDGLEYIYEESKQTSLSRKIYQFSIDKNPKNKIKDTITTLQKNKIEFRQVFYYTSISVANKDDLTTFFIENDGIFVTIHDCNWFVINVNNSPSAISIFERFEADYIHDYTKSHKGFELVNVEDPRIFIYLRQQIDNAEYGANLSELLVDTLILLSLEGTDSTQSIYRNHAEILSRINDITNFDQKWLTETVDKRLKILSAKPLRRIKHHKSYKGYCLPYQTRVELAHTQMEDEALHKSFHETALDILKKYLNEQSIQVHDTDKLVERVFHDIFSQQGLEFSQFITTGDAASSIEKSIKEIVSNVVADSSVIAENKDKCEAALLRSIRDIVYRGDEKQLEYLRRLSNTYRLLFLLQCDPKLATYFEVMAGKLQIYVDTSILIPALSEYFLDQPNQRYSNLLISARDAGITLKVNSPVMAELAAHFGTAQKRYHLHYQHDEDLYKEEFMFVYVYEIMIRAYYYAKLNKKVESFKEYYEHFVSWDADDPVVELVEWVKAKYGIVYEEIRNLNLKVNKQDEELLYQAMLKYKGSESQARTDTKQLLMIYALREKHNELGEAGAFGYNTWWLTTDTNSQEAFKEAFKSPAEHGYHGSPYIRADFLHNYIALAPSRVRVNEIYKRLFPTLVGVNISFHIPPVIAMAIRRNMRKHGDLVRTPRFRGAIRALTEQLKSNPNLLDRHKVELVVSRTCGRD